MKPIHGYGELREQSVPRNIGRWRLREQDDGRIEYQAGYPDTYGKYSMASDDLNETIQVSYEGDAYRMKRYMWADYTLITSKYLGTSGTPEGAARMITEAVQGVEA
mgnify:CR=1 FL=1